jgi:integrase
MALTDTFVRQVKHKGAAAGDKHADGGGMYLLVKPAGKYWRMDYRFAGKRKTLALGTYPEVALSRARQRRDKARELLADQVDPSAAKQQEKRTRIDAAANTFRAVSDDWLERTAARRAEVTQEKVRTWLVKDVHPFIGEMSINEISARDVLDKVIRRLERRGAIDTAHRVKQLCGQVFRFAVVSGLAKADPTVDLKEALTVKAPRHHAALTEPKQLGELLRAIHSYEGAFATVVALKIAPLVFVRPGELRTAEWSEIDLSTGEWRIPASKMKMANDHIVPLARQVVRLLTELRALTGRGRYVFPSIRTEQRCMSENTLNAALRGMGYATDVHTAHGFRATARTILDEVLNERVDLIEHQLAHRVKDANGRAYNRTAHLPARKDMMQRWADYLDSLRESRKVVPLRSAA